MIRAFPCTTDDSALLFLPPKLSPFSFFLLRQERMRWKTR